MPKSKKAPPKNSFYFYMKELQEEYRLKGFNYGMERMAELASPTWKGMDAAERAPYEKLAKEDKLLNKNNQKKLDCTGNPISENQQIALENFKKENDMVNFIENSLNALSIEEITQQPFYFISTHTFCKIEDLNYLPAEIGLVKYSIDEGIMAEYHEFIYPGPVPPGYRWSCQEKSLRSHKIPVDNFELASDDYNQIIENIYKLMNVEGYPDKKLVLYCFTEELEQTDFVVNTFLMRHVPKFKQRQFKVYDICPLLCNLYGRFERYSPGVVQNEWLRSTTFKYKPNTCCKWHWDSEEYECALGNVKSYSFIFSDHLCDLYNVTVISGKHFPDAVQASATSQNSCTSSNMSKKRPTASASTSFTSSLSHLYDSDTSYCPELASTSSELELLPKCSTESKYSGKSFATAAMKQKKQSEFELTKEDFPGLESRSNSSQSSMTIDVSNWRSSSSQSGMSGISSSESRVRLGRGSFIRK